MHRIQQLLAANVIDKQLNTYNILRKYWRDIHSLPKVSQSMLKGEINLRTSLSPTSAIRKPPKYALTQDMEGHFFPLLYGGTIDQVDREEDESFFGARSLNYYHITTH